MEQKNQINLFNKFKNFFIKSGKSSLALKIVSNLLVHFSTKYRISPLKVVLVLYNNLNCFIEVRQISIKRRRLFVPFSIGINRRLFLVFKKLKDSLLLDKQKISTLDKLKIECLLILREDKSSKALKIKRQNISKTLINRSNTHFRW